MMKKQEVEKIIDNRQQILNRQIAIVRVLNKSYLLLSLIFTVNPG